MIDIKTFIVIIIIVISSSYILLNILIKKANQSKENNETPDFSQKDKSLNKKQRKTFSYYAFKTFGWALIIIWLFIYIFVPSELDYADGASNPLSFKFMVSRPLENLVNDISIGYWEDAILGLIPFAILNFPFFLGLGIVFPKIIKKIFYIISYPFDKVLLILDRFSIKQSISILENNFGLGIYRLLLIVWLISFTVSTIFGFIDNDDYFVLSIILFIFYWPTMLGLERAYKWIKDGFDKDHKTNK